MIVGVDINPAQARNGASVRHDALRQPEGGRRRLVAHLVGADRRRRRLQLRLHRQHRGDAPGARMLPPRLGQSSSSASPAPARRSRRGRSSWSPAGSGRAPRSAARAAAPTCRRSSTGTWTARSSIDPMITHTLPLDDINKGFDLMHAGGAGAVNHDDRNRFPQSIAWRHAGRLQARQPRDRDRHDLFGLCPSASGRREAAGGLVSVGPDLHPRQRHGKGRIPRRLRRTGPDLRRAGHQPARRRRARRSRRMPTISGLAPASMSTRRRRRSRAITACGAM
jgi:hypothetical protein